MKFGEAISILFCWVLSVLFAYELNRGSFDPKLKRQIGYVTTYTVTQDGIGADMSITEFNALSGDYSNCLFLFSGEITAFTIPKIHGWPNKPVMIDGGTN